MTRPAEMSGLPPAVSSRRQRLASLERQADVRAGQMPDEPARGEPGAEDEPEHRAKTAGRGRPDDVEPGHRALEIARQDRQARCRGDVAAQCLVEEPDIAE